ncbi:GlsB/YeaQ/YmgE family stress response membrane protein [Neobacillus niacini]|uniref:GlsB/YeaQ/YmgE family stress response membrane protein n=1 Tax=Neobacillus niacini TaxID=86668 RepID=UPI0021CB4B30|nr:GlsB/YeaQ/YmgE family stress response membrane protein [Neobacillus niacini]MCM3764918.1 GlsB/YeaQ/YmgE family stress response membrane protein [Neobacillus niacini]
MTITSFLMAVIIAFVIGTVAEKLSPLKMPGSWAAAIFAGFVGAWLGEYLFGTFGPAIGGVSLLPALLGAIVVVIIGGIITRLFD